MGSVGTNVEKRECVSVCVTGGESLLIIIAFP